MTALRRMRFLIAAAVLLASPLAADAQETARVWRVGFVSPSAPGPTIQSFRQGLEALGYVEGKNVVVETRFADGHADRLPGLIAEVIGSKVDVLVVGSAAGALAAKRATATLPVVFAGIIDPVAPGIVTSLARPGGNLTGTTFGIGGSGFAGKWVELLKEAVPNVSHVAVLQNPASPTGGPLVRELQVAARTLNVKLDVFDVGDPAKLDGAFAAIRRSGARGVIVTNDPFFHANRDRLVRLAATARLPAVYFTNDFAEAGGLMSYGSSLADSYRRAATYVDKILKGAKPGDLPVEQPTKFELIINVRTAKALGLKIPESLLIRADRVIE